MLNRGTRARFAFHFASALLVSATAFAQESVDPNKFLAFKKLFVAELADNVDGAYRVVFEQAAKKIFEKNPRFELTSDMKVADSVLRTTLDQKRLGTNIEMRLFVRNPDDAKRAEELFSLEKTTIPAQAPAAVVETKIRDLLKVTLRRVPFYGSVTGRDSSNVTLDIGMAHGIKQGDTVQISRIESFKRHPMLKSIIDVQLVPSGSIEIDDAEEKISFGHVKDQLTGEEIQRLYKVTAVEAKPKELADQEAANSGHPTTTVKKSPKSTTPEYGFLDLGVFIGTISASTSINNGSSTFAGSSLSPGGRLTAELWLTKNFFADLKAGAHFASYNQSDARVPSNVSPNYSTTVYSFSADGGYRFFLDDTIYGTQAYVKVGYSMLQWTSPIDTTYLIGPRAYSGINLGFGGSMPFGKSRFGLLTNMSIMFFPSVKQGGIDGLPEGGDTSSTAIGFYVGGYYFISPRMAFRMGFAMDLFSTDYAGTQSGTTAASTSIKQVGALPSLVYYF